MPLRSAQELASANQAVLLCPEGTAQGRTEGQDYNHGMTTEPARARILLLHAQTTQ